MPAFDIEINGPNVIAESERSGNAHSLFWPWAGANVSLLALSAAGSAVAQSWPQKPIKVIAPYPIPEPIAQIAAQALSPMGLALMQERVQELNKQKALIKAELLRLACVKEVFEDKGNFVLVRFNDGASVFAAMKAAGIILRDFSTKPGLDNSIRITIGYQGEMDAVIAVLRDVSANQMPLNNPSAASV